MLLMLLISYQRDKLSCQQMNIGKEIDFEIIFIQHKYSRPLTGGIHCSFMCEIIEIPT